MFHKITLSFWIDSLFAVATFNKDFVMLARKVYRILRSWKGFETIKHAMNVYPGIDWYISGGVVRNAASGINGFLADFDFFVKGEQIQAMLQELMNYGTLKCGQFGSPRWWPMVDEMAYADIIPVHKFFNGLEKCHDIVDVLNQFDFTANAIAIDLRRMLVINPRDGMHDAQEHMIRAVRFDYPDEPIHPGSSLSRNLVLWCRLLHYASKLNFCIDPGTLSWLKMNMAYVNDAYLFESEFFELDNKAFAPLYC